MLSSSLKLLGVTNYRVRYFDVLLLYIISKCIIYGGVNFLSTIKCYAEKALETKLLMVTRNLDIVPQV